MTISSFDTEQNSQFDNFELQITQEAKGYIKETAGWATFLAIIGFICVAFGLLIGIFYMAMSDTMIQGAGSMPKGMESIFSVVGAIMVVGALAMLFPLISLIKFASGVKAALNDNNTDKLTKAFRSLKSHYKFVGILTIIGIAVYILGIVAIVVIGIGTAAGAV